MERRLQKPGQDVHAQASVHLLLLRMNTQCNVENSLDSIFHFLFETACISNHHVTRVAVEAGLEFSIECPSFLCVLPPHDSIPTIVDGVARLVKVFGSICSGD